MSLPMWFIRKWYSRRETRYTDVVSHVRDPSCPVGNREVSIPPPGVAVSGTAAPGSLGYMVVQVNIDFIRGAFCGNGIKDLPSK